MKKMMLAAAALCAVAAFADEATPAKAAAEQPKPAEKTFTVGFDAEFPPYGYKDGNEYKGFDLDLAREVCKRKGWKFVAKPIDWDAKDAELDSGSIDCIWNGFTMQGREGKYAFTPAYVDNSQVVIVAAGDKIAKLADLKGKVVAVQTDTPVQKALQGKDDENAEAAALGKTFKNIVVTATYNNAVMELEAGAVDAVALDIGVAKQKMADKAGKFKMLDEIIMKETYGIGFKKGNDALAAEVWETYKAMLADGTVDKLAAQYKIDGVIK
ncbi:MAG: transporter substrate-binding domain-containing protein [Kiritimatiellae bacterium]|nr:transporter substrate-binding domain-containing protein [Kiritimatiellia bacterium]